MTKYLYSARVLPIGTAVVIPDLGREPVTFTADHFKIERESRNPARLLLDHDLTKQIGKVHNLWRHEGWFIADFTLDPELTAVLSVGQPVSAGLSSFERGGTYLSEVSVVRRGNVEGAKITSRYELRESPPPPAPKRTEPVGEVFYGGPVIRRTIGQVTAVGGVALRTAQGYPIRYVGDDLVIDRPDGTQEIYVGREGRAEAIRNGVLTR